MDLVEPELEGLMPKSRWSRRGFVMTSLATGFALSVQPVSAQTITTDSDRSRPPARSRCRPPTARSRPTGRCPTHGRAVRDRARRAGNLRRRTSTSRISAGVWPRSATSRSRRSFTRARAIRRQYADIPKLVAEVVSKVPDAAGDRRSRRDGRRTRSRPARPTPAKLAITGFCWGGRPVWLYAAHNPGLKAAVSWYGPIDRPRTELQPKYPIDLAAELKCPVLGLYGGADQGIPVESVERMAAACKAAGKTCEFKIYPDAPHGFNADYRPSYRAEAAKDGWARMLGLVQGVRGRLTAPIPPRAARGRARPAA